ncbi:MAG: LLM class F420-dependent oxidoreductase [Chloroflexi bacterium]|nr:MAG: LLM class F420-dependent oxidoreductase [Chloroflexota bacterium]
MSNARPFRFGIKVATDPGDLPTREDWVALARKAEDLGYATFSVADHYTNEILPIAALMYVADATSTLRIGSCVFDINYRHPVLLAKEVAAIDWFSGGRFELGLGAGALRIDYDQVGLPFDPPGVRVQRLAESVSIFKQFFNQDSVTFAGQYYTVTDLPAIPKAAQRPRPPIFIGGGGKKLLTLAAREADIIGVEAKLHDDKGNTVPSERTEAALGQKVAMLREVAGARFASIELNYGFRAVIVTDDRQQAAEQYARERGTGVTAEEVLADPYLLIGTVEQMVETLERRRDQFGISYLQVFFQNIDTFAPVVARLAAK